MSKVVRVSVDLQKEKFDQLAALVDGTCSVSKAEVMRAALDLYAFVVKQETLGAAVMVVPAPGRGPSYRLRLL